MPLYEYRCKKCGHEFEIIRKFSDGPLRKAPDCPKDRTCRLEKLVSASAFHLKGGGWYDDGYGKKPKSKSGGSSDSGEKSGEKSADSGDSKKKPDKKADKTTDKTTDKKIDAKPEKKSSKKGGGSD